MAKGGGRGKGRPRKAGNIAGISPSTEKEMVSAGNINGTVAAHEELGENSRTNINEDIIADHATVSEVEIASSEHSMDGDLDLEMDKEEDRNQIQETKNEQPMRNRGMRLGYVAPTIKQGTPTACLTKSEIEKENLKWKCAVILYIIGEAPTITYIAKYLRAQCNIEKKFDIFYHAEGYFVIRFETMEDRDNVLYGGPHTIANRPAIVKEWMMNFCFEKEMLTEIPLWIQLPNLPLNCWSSDSLSRIGSVIGKPVCADECTTQQKRISYSRMLVEVDITQPLKYKVQIEGENGTRIDQKILYEWAPMFCQKCHKLGHVCKDMKPAPAPQKIWQKRPTPVHEEEQKAEKVEEVAQPKDKGKGKLQEEWEQPKRQASATIQVGRLHIQTSNVFGIMQEGDTIEKKGIEGGGRIPLAQG